MNEGGRFLVAVGVLFIATLVVITALRGTWSQTWAVITNTNASAGVGPAASGGVAGASPGPSAGSIAGGAVAGASHP